MRIEIFNTLPEHAARIRIAVFMEEQGFLQEFDDIDGICSHLVGYDGQAAVATCRIWQSEKDWHVGRLAVIKEHRGTGLGAQMLGAAEQFVKAQGGTSLTLHAQCRAEAFYTRCGYLPFGEIDDDEGVLHVHMSKTL